MKTLISQHTLDSSEKKSCSAAPLGTWLSDQHDRRVIALSPKCVLKPCTSKIHVKIMLNFPWSLGVGSHPLSDMLDQRASNPSRYRMMHTAAGERKKMRISTQHGIKMDTLLFQSA